LAVRTGHLDEARALLVESVVGGEDTSISTQNVTFSLIASAELAMAGGDPRQAALAPGAADGLRHGAGRRAWPSARRGEADLVARVAEKLGSENFHRVFADGSRLNRREAVVLVHDVANGAPATSHHPGE